MRGWSWLSPRGEVSALVTLAASMPLGFFQRDARFDGAARYPTPVVLVHGLLGSASNFLHLRRVLAVRGVRNLRSFSYLPSVDVPRVAHQLADAVEALCDVTGAAWVDVVGHSLGGMVGRYLLELDQGRLVRRLVTLGAPCFTPTIARRELAIFGARDALAPPPRPPGGGRARVVPDWGHFGLLHHPAVLRDVARYLTGPAAAVVRRRSARPADVIPRAATG